MYGKGRTLNKVDRITLSVNISYMTLTAIRNQIITILLDKGTFSLSLDLGSIKLKKVPEKVRPGLVIAAFKRLEELRYVTRIDSESDVFWIMDADSDSANQSISISSGTAETVANVINQYRDAFNIKSAECDKLSIKEDDVLSLVIICSALLNNVEKLGNSQDDPDNKD